MDMNKAVLVFAGREHHCEKMHNVYVALVALHGGANWVVANNSINIDPSTAFINDYAGDREYFHLYNFADEKLVDRIKSDIQRLNEKILIPDNFKNVPPFWLAQAIRESVEVDHLYNRFLDTTDPWGGLMILHANNFWTSILAHHSKRRGLPVYSFQEGLLRATDQKIMQKQKKATENVDHVFVWTEDDKRIYEEAGAECNIIVSGPSHLDYVIRQVETKEYEQKRFFFGQQKEQKPLITYALPSLQQYQGNLLEDLHRLATWCYINQHFVYIRAHPFDKERLAQVLKDELERYSPYIFHDAEINLPMNRLLTISDAILSQHSTVGIEAVISQVPFFEVTGNDEKVFESQPYANQLSFKSLDRLHNLHNDRVVEEWTQGFLGENRSSLDGYASLRIAEFISENKPKKKGKNERRKRKYR
jgi:hypothetical protein